MTLHHWRRLLIITHLINCLRWSVTPVMYPVSFLFQEASTAYVFLIIVNLFVGCTCLFVDAIVKGVIYDEVSFNWLTLEFMSLLK